MKWIKNTKVLATIMFLSLIGLALVQFLVLKNTWNESKILITNRVNNALNNFEQQLDDRHKLQVFSSAINNQDTVLNELIIQTDSSEINIKSLPNLSDSLKVHELKSEFSFIQIDSSDTKKNVQAWTTGDSLEFTEMKSFIGQVRQEILILNSEFDFRLDSLNVAQKLEENLKMNQLNEPYFWAVHNQSEFLFGNNQEIEANFETSLFPNDILLSKKHTLKLYYPLTPEIWNKMGISILLSISFLLVLVVIFMLTLNQLNKHKKISAIKSDFLNNLTHEFKTPLATISLANDTIIHESVINNPSEIKKYSTIIGNEKNKLNKHVESILELAALDKNKLHIQLQPIPIYSELQKAIQQYKILAERKNIRVNFEVENESATVLGDKKYINAIISNLLDNAIKYSNEKTIIHVEIKEEMNRVQVNITDQGRGMSNKELEKVFDIFYRVDSGNLHQTKGFGIGLSFVKKMMVLFNGEVLIKSQLNKGTMVTLNFVKA